MGEPAFSRMTLGDFLTWEDETDARHELIGGFVVAMAPPAENHGALAARVIARLETRLAARRPEIDTVDEILLAGSDGRYAELHRRDGTHWISEIFHTADDVIVPATVGTEISISDLYDGIAFDDELAS